MKKTYDEFKKKNQQIDFLIQVVDARAITYSANKELCDFFVNKQILTVAYKSDLAQVPSSFFHDPKLIISNQEDKQIKSQIINHLKKILKMDEMQFHPILLGLVVGLPNSGKSTLINKILNKKQVVVQNKPGTTKNLSLQKISSDLYLYDSPGIMYKKIDDLVTGYVLCLIGTINKNIVPLYEVLNFGIKFLKKYYPAHYNKLVNNTKSFTFDELLTYLASLWNFDKNDANLARSLVLDRLYQWFTDGKIGKISYDDKDLISLLDKGE